jgi:hypothetical protein
MTEHKGDGARGLARVRHMKAGDRVVTALVLGGWGAFIAYFTMVSHPQHLAKDFSYPWRGARALLQGLDPYQVIHGGAAYPFNAPLFYPLPAAILAVPFAPLRPEIAGALFVGVSSTLLGWAVLRDCPHRLPLFISAPFVQAAILGQWSPLLTAAALMPALQFAAAAKPTIGVAAWLYKPSWRGVIGGLILALVALLILPRWPLEWRAAMAGTARYRGPATTLMGCFLLLGVLRWRRREGRLFVAMSLMPQLPVFYDQLLLWLIPSGVWRSVALSAMSWIGYLAWYPSRTSPLQNEVAFPWMVLTLYAPALVLLLLLPSREVATAAESGSAQPVDSSSSGQAVQLVEGSGPGQAHP